MTTKRERERRERYERDRDGGEGVRVIGEKNLHFRASDERGFNADRKGKH